MRRDCAWNDSHQADNEVEPGQTGEADAEVQNAEWNEWAESQHEEKEKAFSLDGFVKCKHHGILFS